MVEEKNDDREMESSIKWWVKEKQNPTHMHWKQWKDKPDTKIRQLSAVYRADSRIQKEMCPCDTLYDQASALKAD